MVVRDEKSLARAIENGENHIEIEGELAGKIIRIKATGNVAWAIAIGAIGVAVMMALGSGGVAAPASALTATGAVGILELSATSAAIGIAVAAGGIGILSKLRGNYKMEKISHIKLIKK